MLRKGEVMELEEAVAEWVSKDSPGVLHEVGDKGASLAPLRVLGEAPKDRMGKKARGRGDAARRARAGACGDQHHRYLSAGDGAGTETGRQAATGREAGAVGAPAAGCADGAGVWSGEEPGQGDQRAGDQGEGDVPQRVRSSEEEHRG